MVGSNTRGIDDRRCKLRKNKVGDPAVKGRAYLVSLENRISGWPLLRCQRNDSWGSMAYASRASRSMDGRQLGQ